MRTVSSGWRSSGRTAPTGRTAIPGLAVAGAEVVAAAGTAGWTMSVWKATLTASLLSATRRATVRPPGARKVVCALAPVPSSYLPSPSRSQE
jgi:hypothetical protein